MITPHWGERVGFIFSSCWGCWFNGYFPLGSWVSGLLGGEGGFLWLLHTGEVDLIVTSCWGSWF